MANSVWDGCVSGCDIVIPTGSTGDPGASISGFTNQTSSTGVLAPEETGLMLGFNRAAGVDITLPSAPPNGTYYMFDVITAVTSNDYSISTRDTDVLGGYVFGMKDATAPERFLVSGSRTIISMNGTTTGGLVGTRLTLIYNSGVWYVSGNIYGSGVLSTPFA